MTLIASGRSYLGGEIKRDEGSFWECVVVVVATVAWNTPRQTFQAHVSWCTTRGLALMTTTIQESTITAAEQTNSHQLNTIRHESAIQTKDYTPFRRQNGTCGSSSCILAES